MKNKLLLSKSIYHKEAVQRAISDYIQLCYIKLVESEKYYVCEFTNCKYDVNETIFEFENYIIDIMNT